MSTAHDPRSSHRLGDLREGVMMLVEGAGFLRRQRALWALASIPVLFALLFVAGAATAFWMNLDWIREALTSWQPELEATSWWTWLWVGPGRALFWLLAWLGVVLAFGVSLIASLLLANLAAAPFVDRLSQRVEQIVVGRVESGPPGLPSVAAEILRSFGAELQRLSFLAGIWLVLSLGGLVIPGAQLVTGPLLIVVTVLFLPLDYCGFALDRRQIPFRVRRRWLREQLPTMTGFGGVAFLACFVPGLNLLILPAMVTAGTLLVLRRTPRIDPQEASIGSSSR